MHATSHSFDFVIMLTLPTCHVPTHVTSHSFCFVIMLIIIYYYILYYYYIFSHMSRPMHVTSHVFLICSYVMTAIILHICQLPMHAECHVHLALF